MANGDTQKRDEERPLDDNAELDALLDEALRLTFPASDPIAINVERFRKRKEEHTGISSTDSETEVTEPIEVKND